MLLQYGPALASEGRAALDGSREDQVFVLVAPAVSIDDGRQWPSPPWENRQLCDDVSPAAVDDFIARFVGQGPGND